jgi:hypothetical protein
LAAADKAGDRAQAALDQTEEAALAVIALAGVVVLVDAKLRARLQRDVSAVTKAQLHAPGAGFDRVAALHFRSFGERPHRPCSIHGAHIADSEFNQRRRGRRVRTAPCSEHADPQHSS